MIFMEAARFFYVFSTLKIRTKLALIFKSGKLDELWKNGLKTRKFGIAISVFNMDGMDGFEAVEAIRARKIEDDPASPKYLQTVRGFGYRFNS